MSSPEVILAERYQIVRSLGGRSGKTMLARDLQLPNMPACVVKEFKPKSHNTKELAIAKHLFDREAKNLYILGNHDQIPRLFANFEQQGKFYWVQEFIEGKPLNLDMMAWQETEVIALLGDVLRVLAFAHGLPIVHGDIKPANLIRRHLDLKIVLIGFSAIENLGEDSLDSSTQNEIDNTFDDALAYRPSEQLAGQLKLSSDLYALGLICLQALTGITIKELRKWVIEESSNEYSTRLVGDRLNIKINLGLAAMIDKMVRHDHNQRYKDAREALREFEQFFNSNVININSNSEDENANLRMQLEEPEGQVELGSRFYIQRQMIETDCCEGILRPGSLIRIKAPRKMGKSSLLSRSLAYAKQKEYQVAHLYFHQADSDVFRELDSFLQWFCASIAAELELENHLDEYWQGVLGSKNKCTKYFQRYLLQSFDTPLVCGLDDVDLIFQYPKIADDFLGLLRAWHEKAKNEEIWKRLRLVIVHSKEVYIPLNINRSPFNVGIPIELTEFTRPQLADLVQRYQLDWSSSQVEQLMVLTGGYPYLVKQALYQVARGRVEWENLLELAATESGIYSDHLRSQLSKLKEDSQMLAAFKDLVTSDRPMLLDNRIAFNLRSIGLVKFQGNQIIPMCNLYSEYFREYFQSSI